MGTSSNLVWAPGQGLRNTGGGDTVETEESVEQDRDETVGYNSFPNTKLIFETCLYRIRSRSRSPLLWIRQSPSCDRFANYSSLVYSGVVEKNFPARKGLLLELLLTRRRRQASVLVFRYVLKN